MLRRKILALCLCLMTAGAALASPADSLEVKRPKAKWRGGASVEAGSNFHLGLLGDRTHDTGSIDANIGFTKGKFDLDLASKLYNEHQITGKAAGNVRIADNDTTLKVDGSVNDRKKLNTESSLNLKWHPGRNTYRAYYGFKTTSDIPYNYNLTTIELEEEEYSFDYSLESGHANSHTHRTGTNFEHIFPDSDKSLYVGLDAEIFSSGTYSEWSIGKATTDAETYDITGNIEESRYRQTPYSLYLDCKLGITYTDKALFGVKDLRGDFSYSARTKGQWEEMSAATYVDGQWRDSLSARETFLYTTLATAPAAHISYKRGGYALDLTYSPEYFSYELDGDGRQGDVKSGDVAHLLEFNNTFKPWDRHTFSLKCKRTDERPSYLQICWFPRFSSVYSDEMYMGNPDLKNSTTNTGRLSYDYAADRFSAGIEFSDVFKPRKIERTFNNETVGEKEYRVYTWVNEGRSNELSVDLHTKWKAERLSLTLSAKYRYYRGTSANGNETRSSDYSINSNVSYTLKTWKFESNAAYQSGLNRSYYSLSSTIDGNFKLTKTFGKHFTVYLYGKNLLDKPLMVETISADEKEIRYEKMLSYKRLLKLGVTYKF